jgi:hypothetical protein
MHLNIAPLFEEPKGILTPMSILCILYLYGLEPGILKGEVSLYH